MKNTWRSFSLSLSFYLKTWTNSKHITFYDWWHVYSSEFSVLTSKALFSFSVCHLIRWYCSRDSVYELRRGVHISMALVYLGYSVFKYLIFLEILLFMFYISIIYSTHIIWQISQSSNDYCMHNYFNVEISILCIFF